MQPGAAATVPGVEQTAALKRSRLASDAATRFVWALELDELEGEDDDWAPSDTSAGSSHLNAAQSVSCPNLASLNFGAAHADEAKRVSRLARNRECARLRRLRKRTRVEVLQSKVCPPPSLLLQPFLHDPASVCACVRLCRLGSCKPTMRRCPNIGGVTGLGQQYCKP